MKNKLINKNSRKKPAYKKQVIATMERITFKTHLNIEVVARKIARNLMPLTVVDLFSENSNSELNQTDEIINKVLLNAHEEINFQKLSRFLPELGSLEISARATDKFLNPFKEVNPHNPFGSPWNELTAILSSQRLGISQVKLHKKIDSDGPLGKKLRTSQSEISEELEFLIKKNIEVDIPEVLSLGVKLETWLRFLIEESRKFISTTKSNLSKTEVTNIISDSLSALLFVLDFTHNQTLAVKKLRETLLSARMEKAINLIDLHCMIFINSPEGGVKVSESAEDRFLKDSEGRVFKISQADLLDGVSKFADILSKFNIKHKIIILVIDNDKFVLKNQEANIANFLKSLSEVVRKHPLGKRDFEIIPASKLVNPSFFLNVWQKKDANIDKLVERLVNEEFDKLQQRTLPSIMQTRGFAREIASKSFLIQFGLGSTLHKVFEQPIFLQSAKAHQQATEIFRLGCKIGANNEPLIITHWKGRQEVEL